MKVSAEKRDMKKFLILVILFTSFTNLFSQTDNSNLNPIASRIRARVFASDIILTWKDSQGLSDAYYQIYRFTDTITEENIDNSELLATIPAGTEIYADRAPDAIYYYYAVILTKGAATYKTFIEYRNTTADGVNVDPTRVPEVEFFEVTNVSAESLGSRIAIYFSCDTPDKELIVYRSLKQIFNVDDLSTAMLVTELNSSEERTIDEGPFLDGIPYYYAVVGKVLSTALDPNSVSAGNTTHIPIQFQGINPIVSAINLEEETTVDLNPVYQRDTQRVENRITTNPYRQLPFPSLIDEYSQEEELDIPTYNGTTSVSGDVVERADVLEARYRDSLVSTILPIEIINGDLDLTTQNGRQFSSVIKQLFVNERWYETLNSLSAFLQDGVEEELIAKAHFYRGQCYYFMLDYTRAYLEFNLADKYDIISESVNPWSDEMMEIIRTN